MTAFDSWWMLAGFVVPAVLVVLATVAITIKLGMLEKKLERLRLPKENEKERDKRDEVAAFRGDVRKEFDSLRTEIRGVHSATQKLLTLASRPPKVQEPPRVSAPAYDSYSEEESPAPAPVDGVAQLLAVANHILQQPSMSLEAFRASTSVLEARISAYPNADGRPVAFLVEYRGSLYAVPNSVKPARLPQEWFNRGSFGVNDEIRRVVSLPRLSRRGDGFDVQEPGVFAR